MPETSFLPVCHWCLPSCYPGTGAQREWVWISSCGGSLNSPWVFSITQSLLVFAARSCGGLSSGTGALGSGSWFGWGWDSSLPRYPSQIFYPTHMVVGPACSVSLPLLPVWSMWLFFFCSCQTFIQPNFCWFWLMIVLYFSCNFDDVVRGEPCLPMPLSWPEVLIVIGLRGISFLLCFHSVCDIKWHRTLSLSLSPFCMSPISVPLGQHSFTCYNIPLFVNLGFNFILRLLQLN